MAKITLIFEDRADKFLQFIKEDYPDFFAHLEPDVELTEQEKSK